MEASEIFHKTAKGQSEIETKSNALSLKERRVLILVNGENNIDRLKQLSLCENTPEILDTLLRQGLIEQVGEAAATGPDKAAPQETGAAADISAREFMSNTLLTFANRVRVAELLGKIGAAEDIDGLKNLVNPWYHALSETPGGMYQADDLRDEVKRIIANEESAAAG